MADYCSNCARLNETIFRVFSERFPNVAWVNADLALAMLLEQLPAGQQPE
jgi:hypothetical protein